MLTRKDILAITMEDSIALENEAREADPQLTKKAIRVRYHQYL